MGRAQIGTLTNSGYQGALAGSWKLHYSRGVASCCAEWLAQVKTAESCIEGWVVSHRPSRRCSSLCQEGDAKVTFGIVEDEGPACCTPTIPLGPWVSGSLGIRKGDPVTAQGKRLDEEVRWKDGSGSFGR